MSTMLHDLIWLDTNDSNREMFGSLSLGFLWWLFIRISFIYLKPCGFILIKDFNINCLKKC